jgi:hypothetical protein
MRKQAPSWDRERPRCLENLHCGVPACCAMALPLSIRDETDA